MRKGLTYILLLLLLAAGQAWAGVVEDAEEELKKLGRGQERLVVSGAGRHAAGYPTRSVTSRTSKSRTGSNKARRGRTRSTDTGSGSVSSDSTQPDPVMPSGRTKKDSDEKHKGRLVSFGVVLLFALLIFLATAASRRLGTRQE